MSLSLSLERRLKKEHGCDCFINIGYILSRDTISIRLPDKRIIEVESVLAGKDPDDVADEWVEKFLDSGDDILTYLWKKGKIRQ